MMIVYNCSPLQVAKECIDWPFVVIFMVKVFFFLPKENLARKPKGCKPIDVDYYAS
jgi:hypothetical protein